ncbi:hypothetical protein PGTUg99_008241 [Puccinia graminis f. sp. tritici]|uniref:Uncharacterized protein n=1 Tax=Puccinia graminis f. sp. tritici TaxID=56615 RepID=A0A5B0RHA4_PUCGR|nr:hypothetical protein PGTUg99_008241 [Puccinia graminis f. sp. tritici]
MRKLTLVAVSLTRIKRSGNDGLEGWRTSRRFYRLCRAISTGGCRIEGKSSILVRLLPANPDEARKLKRDFSVDCFPSSSFPHFPCSATRTAYTQDGHRYNRSTEGRSSDWRTGLSLSDWLWFDAFDMGTQ